MLRAKRFRLTAVSSVDFSGSRVRDGAEYLFVGPAADIRAGQSRAYRVGRYDVAVFNVAGELYAIENFCPHQGAPLTDGWVDGPLVTCSWHAWCFDVRTGTMTLGDFAMIPRFGVLVEGADLFVTTEPLEEE